MNEPVNPGATDAVTPAKRDPENARMIADVRDDINALEIALVMLGLGADNRLREPSEWDQSPAPRTIVKRDDVALMRSLCAHAERCGDALVAKISALLARIETPIP